jgi:hypothetical protein
MKDRTLIYLSLALSVASLGYAAWVHQQGSEALAARALRQREAELVQKFAPKMETIYRDLVLHPKRIPTNPTTLEELLEPLVLILNEVGDAGGGETNKLTKK